MTLPPAPPVETRPPEVVVPPVVEVPVVQVPVVTPDPVVEQPKPDVPQLPEQKIQWGRWLALNNRPATISGDVPEGGIRVRNGDYAVIRTAGNQYTTPERGSASFVLKDGEATIRNADRTVATTTADLKNGSFAVDFGKGSYVTSFDLVNGKETFNMKSDGLLVRDGRFGNSSSDPYTKPDTNNMQVDGMLSNENGGSAAYVFFRRLNDAREINGVTVWGVSK